MGVIKLMISIAILLFILQQNRPSPSRMNNCQLPQFRLEPATKYPCVCPGLRRPVCVYNHEHGSVSGLYANLCIADSFTLGSGKDSNYVISPRFLCQKTSPPLSNYSVDEYNELLLMDIQKESAVYKQVYSILYKLLDLSSIPGASPCTCPGIQRPVYSYGREGFMSYENACHLKCFALANKTPVLLFTSLEMLYQNGTYQLIEGESESQRETRELNSWITEMNGEILFYKKFHQAFDGLFPLNEKNKKY